MAVFGMVRRLRSGGAWRGKAGRGKAVNVMEQRMRLATEKEAYAHLRISRATLRRMVERKEIAPPIKFGRTVRYDLDLLEASIREMQAEAKQ